MPKKSSAQPAFVPRDDRQIALTSDIEQLLRGGAAAVIGVSGGKDSVACALAVHDHLERIGHTGPRLLIHADLGSVEWADSQPSCQRLADHLGYEIVTVRRRAGGMMQRWQSRWAGNVARYAALECVTLIPPWSTAKMRFCTSELKAAPITAALKKRFHGMPIVNATGIRRQESTARRNKPVATFEAKRSAAQTPLWTWNPVIDWSIESVFGTIGDAGLPLHEAYTKYNSSRVSCAFCILGSIGDLRASASCSDNHGIYREMVQLEIDSGFSFQADRWLADVAPAVLEEDAREAVAASKARAVKRVALEKQIPKHLLYTKGWPTSIPSVADAELLASVRADVAGLYGFDVRCTDPSSIIGRYEELIAEKSAGGAKERARRSRAARVTQPLARTGRAVRAANRGAIPLVLVA